MREAKRLHVVACLALAGALLLPLTSGQSQPQGFWDVNDIGTAMYGEQQFLGGCYKLLNRTGTVGCSAPTQDRVSAMLIKLEDVAFPLFQPLAILASTANATAFLKYLAANPAVQSSVAAVLVYNGAVMPASDSASTAFPSGAEFAVYSTPTSPSTYTWNPFGTALGSTFLPFPVFYLGDSLASTALWRASYNYQNNFKGAANWAIMELSMTATQPNSSACLGAGTCLPLGGFNVWTAMPPLPTSTVTNTSVPNPALPTTLVVSSLDSNGVFHDFVQAADGPLSGLIAMLTAMSILSKANESSLYTRQLVFAGLAGEVWNYMGSKRLTWDLTGNGTAFTAGLNLSSVDQVIEVGMIGRAFDTAANKSVLYLHSQPAGGAWGDPTSLLSTLQGSAAVSTDVALNVSLASTTNPGLPPSSIHAFLRAKPNIAGVLISEFDKQYTNPYYQSAFDNGSFVALDPIVSTAVLLARTLHQLAAPATAAPLLINLTTVTATAYQLATCIMLDSPGMSCSLATSLLNPDFQVTDQIVSYALRHYIGILQYIHPNPADPYYKGTLYRFLWNYMGTLAAVPVATGNITGQSCAFSASACPLGYSCIGWKGSNTDASLMGKCMRTTVSYSPALSTGLTYTPNDAGPVQYFFTNASLAWEAAGGWPPDPMWTESYWPSTTPYIQVLEKESRGTEWATLGAGLGACALTAALSWWGQRAFEKHLKGSS